MNIYLGHNPIESRGVQIISEALKTHTLIQELNFSNEQPTPPISSNSFTIIDYEAYIYVDGCDLKSEETTNRLGEALKGFKELITLNVGRTNLSGERAKNIVEAIFQHPNLQKLHLGNIYRICSVCICYMSYLFTLCVYVIYIIYIGNNPIGGIGIIIIGEILLKQIPKLTHLDLST